MTGSSSAEEPTALDSLTDALNVEEIVATVEDMTESIGDIAEDAADKFEWIGRVGWVAKGIVYLLIGVLFINIAVAESGSGEANQAGAIEAIAQKPGGTLLIVALGIGLALYAFWRVLTVVLPGDWTGHALLDRIGYAVSAAIYISLLLTVVEIVRSANNRSTSEEDNRIENIVATVLEVSAGRTMVIVGGLVVAVIGLAFIRKGWTRSFRSQISGDDGAENTAIDRLGTIGWIARGVSMLIIGAFLAQAAWTFQPDQAAGLDDSIRQLADNPAGGLLAACVGAGFIAYGVFAVLSARHRDLKGPQNEHD